MSTSDCCNGLGHGCTHTIADWMIYNVTTSCVWCVLVFGLWGCIYRCKITFEVLYGVVTACYIVALSIKTSTFTTKNQQ